MKRNRIIVMATMIFVMAIILTQAFGQSARSSKVKANTEIIIPTAEDQASMAYVAPGNFVMGDTFAEFSEGLPVHTVYVSGFYIGKYEVTKALWNDVYNWAIMHGYIFDNAGSGKDTDHPVQMVSWYDCVKWCNARSEKEGKSPAYYTSSAKTMVYRTGQVNIDNSSVNWNTGYRLPTEAEWEKAARGGSGGHRFPWYDTDNITHDYANYYSSSSYAYDVSSSRGFHPFFNDGMFPYTSPVGYFASNGYGLYDMAGNIWEWCWDWYDLYSSDSQIDPRGPESISYRIIRGGSWGDYAFRCRATDRYHYYISTGKDDVIGFRPVLSSISEWKQVIEAQPEQPTYGNCPAMEPGKDSLVLVTHGWIRKEIGQTLPPNPDWVDTMVELIRANIASQGLNNWQVESYKWTDKAWQTIPQLIKGDVLDSAEKEGGNLGNYLANQGWSHIHLIGHSAGAAVIQAAALNIKCANVNTVVHTTFLDPYVGFTYGGRSKYGLVANWADNYFSFDTETFDDVVGKTQGELDHAYGVEVTWLDPNKVSFDTYRSSWKETVEKCYKTVSSHSWPVEFYMNTIPPNVQQSSQGFGFPLSKEGGNWDFAQANYSAYSDPIRVLGTPDTPCYTINNEALSSMSLPVNFSQTPSVTSDTGSIENYGSFLILSSTSSSQLRSSKTLTTNVSDTSPTPAWLATVLNITDKINSVSFDAEFESAERAEGILSVYWDTNAIGTIDERVVVPGFRHYTYSIPLTVTNGTHTLGFRLDSFTDVISSVIVTNVALSFVGVPDSFSLSFTGKDADGFTLLKLTGPSGFNYSVETSTNLIDWNTIAILVNTNGTVPFVDKQSSNSAARFYRAVGY
ncbi:MAG: SUMF1/EgtB/PvdO family nonheme iron enzyme [Candidatus Nomurabacteria bacterium]|nr:SUMF1/EgtB/PvdO family nonheme iron enzyme [Candidatus Nomurabacteria bacterium]